MIHTVGEQHVIAYRPSRAPLSRPASRSIVPSSSPHSRPRITNNSADSSMGTMTPRYTIQDFCRSSTSSEATASPRATYYDQHGTDNFLADASATLPVVGPHQPEHAAGIARLINTFNPDVSLKRSHFRDSSASKLCSRTDGADEPLRRRCRVSPPAAPMQLPSRLSAKRLRHASRACSSCGERDTPQWRCGPSGVDTLCNFCGLMYAKRQEKGSDKDHHKSWKKTLKSARVHA